MVDEERESGAFSDVPQVLCLDSRRSKGLGNDDMLSGLERSAAQLVVRRDRGRNGHGLDLGILSTTAASLLAATSVYFPRIAAKRSGRSSAIATSRQRMFSAKCRT